MFVRLMIVKPRLSAGLVQVPVNRLSKGGDMNYLTSCIYDS